mgnify:CR=1 FL=1
MNSAATGRGLEKINHGREQYEGSALSGALVPADLDRSAMAQVLVAKALSKGAQLNGPGGLLNELTCRALESALQVEMSEHLGYEHRQDLGDRGGNLRNGAARKANRHDTTFRRHAPQ